MVSHDQSKDESPDDLRQESFPARQQSKAGERRNETAEDSEAVANFIIGKSTPQTIQRAEDTYRLITAFQFITSACLETQPDQAKAMRAMTHALDVAISLLNEGAPTRLVTAALLHPSLASFTEEERLAVYSRLLSLLGDEDSPSPAPPTLVREPQFECSAPSAKLHDWLKGFDSPQRLGRSPSLQPHTHIPEAPNPSSTSFSEHKKLLIEKFVAQIPSASRPTSRPYSNSDLRMISSCLLEAYNLFAHAGLEVGPRPASQSFQHLCQVGLILAATRQPANLVVAGFLHDMYELKFSLLDLGAIRRLMKIFPARVGELLDAITEPNDGGVRTGYYARKLAVIDRLKSLPQGIRLDASSLLCASKTSTQLEGFQFWIRTGSLEGWSKGSEEDNARLNDALLLTCKENNVCHELVGVFALLQLTWQRCRPSSTSSADS